jgi:hypothetical protein
MEIDDTEKWPVYLRPNFDEALCGTPNCDNVGILGTTIHAPGTDDMVQFTACEQHVAGMAKAAAQVQRMNPPGPRWAIKAVTPVTDMFNIFAMPCGDDSCEHGCTFTVEPCIAILLREAEYGDGSRRTEVVFAARDNDELLGELYPAYHDDNYVGTLTRIEIDMGKADQLVKRRAELELLDQLDPDNQHH